MVRNFFVQGRDLLFSRQKNILSAATVLMLMILASRVLGLVRNRTLVSFFEPHQLDTYLAAFQLPDLIFEILVLGAMSAAFIPVFSAYFGQGKKREAWYLAGVTLNILLLFFFFLALIIFVLAKPIYSLVVAGFSAGQIEQTVIFARILLLVQLIFAASYVLTATLESNQRFLAPAVAPLFYNLGIILTTMVLAPQLGLLAPVLGAVFGSILHLAVQLPLAWQLGFRPVLAFDFKNPGVLRIAKLAAPRVLELSFFQIKRLTDLFLATLVAGGLTYFKFADSLASLPVGLFGLSIAKASLPTLSRQAGLGKIDEFKKTFAASFREIIFLVIPVSIFLAVLRIPAVRLVFGAAQFDWQDTVQTGYTVSAFTIGIFAYSLALLISRSFYALQDTLTPVKISILTIFINVSLGLTFILGVGLPIWGLALAYAVAGVAQILLLLFILARRVGGLGGLGLEAAFAKVTTAASFAGLVMFILLKIFDRSAWDKKLSFLGNLGLALPTTFDRFILDTRYTVNLIMLTGFVALVGLTIYLFLAWLLRIEELGVIIRSVRRLAPPKIPEPKTEALTPSSTNGS